MWSNWHLPPACGPSHIESEASRDCRSETLLIPPTGEKMSEPPSLAPPKFSKFSEPAQESVYLFILTLSANFENGSRAVYNESWWRHLILISPTWAAGWLRNWGEREAKALASFSMHPGTMAGTQEPGIGSQWDLLMDWQLRNGGWLLCLVSGLRVVRGCGVTC